MGYEAIARKKKLQFLQTKFQILKLISRLFSIFISVGLLLTKKNIIFSQHEISLTRKLQSFRQCE